MAQYYFEWDSFRFPEGGTFLGPVDFAFRGPQRQFLSARRCGFAANGGNINPDEMGDWGIGARWSPQWLDGTLGFYYRNYSDKLPQVLLTEVGPGNQPVQPDLWRQHQPVRHQPGEEHRRRQRRRRAVLPPQHAAERAGAGQCRGRRRAAGRRDRRPARQHRQRPGQRARRDPQDRAVRRRHLGRRTGVGAPGVGEERRQPVQWRGLCALSVRGQRRHTARDWNKWDGCSTNNYVGMSAAFTPTWYQVFPGVDLSAPLAVFGGL